MRSVVELPVWAALAAVAVVLVLVEVTNHWLGRLADRWWARLRGRKDARHPWTNRIG